MIPIAKSDSVPTPLKGASSRGGKATHKLIEAAEAGQPLPDFRGDLYGHLEVRQQLLNDQRKKCAFCELDVSAGMYGDVEHFRPKGGWVQADGEPLNQPGYYWLAYDWTNLMLSCQLCNQQFKKNCFPLLNPTKRVKSHIGDLSRERPVLINPSHEDPGKFISFRAEFPVGVDEKGRGERTIEIMGLDRETLNLRRLECLKTLRRINRAIAALEVDQATSEQLQALSELKEEVKDRLANTAEFAAMCRCAIKDSAG